MTDYCKNIFGKSIRELTIEDLEVYFSEVKEESEILEFKSGKGDFEGVFNNNILKTVSAFLNSSGGVLIWGAPEDKSPERGMPKVCVGDFVPVKERKEKDQLINRISSSISYMPTGIRAERLEFNSGYVYIIEVQESDSKPHQLNGQYFIRLDGQSKPAPHYIVDSMFNQIKLADVECETTIVDFYNNRKYNFITIKAYFFNFSKHVIAKNIQTHFYIENGVFEINKLQDIDSQNFPNLHYGINPSTQIVIMVSDDHLVYSDNIVNLQTTIRSDNSLARISSYKINVQDLKRGSQLQDCIKSTTNNLSISGVSYEFFDDKKSYKELILKKR
jgi:hypothetical protein